MTMKTVVNVSCDGENCDHVRANDSNHWLVGVTFDNSIIVSTSRDALSFVTKKNHGDYVKDFCGER